MERGRKYQPLCSSKVVRTSIVGCSSVVKKVHALSPKHKCECCRGTAPATRRTLSMCVGRDVET